MKVSLEASMYTCSLRPITVAISVNTFFAATPPTSHNPTTDHQNHYADLSLRKRQPAHSHALRESLLRPPPFTSLISLTTFKSIPFGS